MSVETISPTRQPLSQPILPVQTISQDEPLVVRAIGFDLDGTLAPTYKNLSALYTTLEHPELQLDSAKFAKHHRDEVNFQQFLHDPGYVRQLVTQWAAARNETTIPQHVMAAFEAEQKKAYELYAGTIELIKRAHEASTIVFIYTNSSDVYTEKWLMQSGIDPNTVDIIWAKSDPKLLEGVHRPDTPWAHKIISYSTFSKPDDTPLRTILESGEISWDQLLFVGEGLNDFNSVYKNPQNPAGVFAFQERGARDISQNQRVMNAHLRPGKEALGVELVQEGIERLGVKSEIITLPNGISDLLDMVGDGRIVLSPATSGVRVNNNQVVRSERPHIPAELLTSQPQIARRDYI